MCLVSAVSRRERSKPRANRREAVVFLGREMLLRFPVRNLEGVITMPVVFPVDWSDV